MLREIQKILDVNSPINVYSNQTKGCARAGRACALRALGLLLADGTPTVGGGRLFDRSTKFFYGNICNSGTESGKMVSKVGN